ncbi:MAG: restriction endonuclease [Terriglobia bacterium]
MGVDILGDWGITATELAEIVAENPSMRGLMFGFVAEYKLRKIWLRRRGISNLIRPRSHDRKQKFDFGFDYKGKAVRLEVKCLDTPKVRIADGVYFGTFQCNASDTTSVTLPDGTSVVTNCLPVGGFDILAVCLFAFGKRWRFAFALNTELPRTTWTKYTPAQQAGLLKSAMMISWPLKLPFEKNLFTVLDRLVAKRVRR